MNLILWIGFIGSIIPGVISSKHHGISKNTFNMNHIRRNKNHGGKSTKQSMILQVTVSFYVRIMVIMFLYVLLQREKNVGLQIAKF